MFSVFLFCYLANSYIIQDDDNDSYETTIFELMGEVKEHPCDRQCSKNNTGRVCHYVFVVELHSTLGKVIMVKITFHFSYLYPSIIYYTLPVC